MSTHCHKPPRYVPYKGTYVPYDGTYGAPDQGQTLDVQESQTAKSALRDEWIRIVPHHTLDVVLEDTLEHMSVPDKVRRDTCEQARPLSQF